jgi:hypothetical protein
VINALLVVRLHELQVLRKANRAQWRSSLWPSGNSSHSGVASTCWWSHSNRPIDYNQKAWKWALSINGKREQHYWYHRMFNSACSLGPPYPNCQKFRKFWKFSDVGRRFGRVVIFIKKILQQIWKSYWRNDLRNLLWQKKGVMNPNVYLQASNLMLLVKNT